MTRFIASCLLFGIFLLSVIRPIYADQTDDLQKQIADLEGKISTAQSQEKTLSSQITLINNQIELKKLQIQTTQKEIAGLEEKIASISGKIDSIGQSLAQNSQILVHRIEQTYIEGSTDPLFYLLGSNNFSDFTLRLEHLQIAQKKDKALMEQMALTKKNYGDQKNDLEAIKVQREQLVVQLNNLNAELTRQNEEKQSLLEVTKNDEKRYQELLAQAKAELAAFGNFVNSQGGASLLSDQTKCDDWGCYYNQRDNKWGGMALNHTGYTLADSGCLVTSMAMVISHYGHREVNPVSINANPSNFAAYYPAYLNYSISAGGASWTRSSISYSNIDGELSAGRPVVVGIGRGPSHFVVLVSGSNGNYTMNDPYVENGNKISFTSKYSLSSMSEIDTVKQN